MVFTDRPNSLGRLLGAVDCDRAAIYRPSWRRCGKNRHVAVGMEEGKEPAVMDEERDGVSVSQVLRAVNTPHDVEELTRMQIARLHTIVQPLFEDLPLAALSASSDQTSARAAGGRPRVHALYHRRAAIEPRAARVREPAGSGRHEPNGGTDRPRVGRRSGGTTPTIDTFGQKGEVWLGNSTAGRCGSSYSR